jgi:hypothetical protein
MKVRLKQPRVTNHGAQNIGEIIDVPDDEGKRMLAKDQCEIVKPLVPYQTNEAKSK